MHRGVPAAGLAKWREVPRRGAARKVTLIRANRHHSTANNRVRLRDIRPIVILTALLISRRPSYRLTKMRKA
jgi:hypothetical protein